MVEKTPRSPIIWESTRIHHPYALIGDVDMGNSTATATTEVALVAQPAWRQLCFLLGALSPRHSFSGNKKGEG
jgi:hypothetical protein